MPAKKSTSRKRTAKKAAKTKSFEETLWDTANKLRGSVEKSNASLKGTLPDNYFSRLLTLTAT